MKHLMNLKMKIILSLSACLFLLSCEKNELKENIDLGSTPKMEGVFMDNYGKDTEIDFLGQKCIVKEVPGYYIFQGDIRINRSELDSINTLPKFKGAAVNGRKWPNSKVYYRIQNGFPNSQRITDAIRHIQAKTNVIFSYSTTASDYIEIVYDATSTYSDWVGKKGGRQVIGIANWATYGNVVHELCHALGLFHEQCRVDRDNSIIINYNNIAPGWRSQYYRYTESGYSGFDFGTFDFGSIMLYSSDNSYNGGWSMTRLNGTPFLGQRTALSNTDISILNYLYFSIPVSIYGQTDLTSGIIKPGMGYSYQVNFGSYGYSSCLWSIRWTSGSNQFVLPGTGRSVTVYIKYEPSIKDGKNEVNYLEVYCPDINQYAWLAINIKDGYRLYSSNGPTPE
jgi:hypothetical protein